MTVSPIRDLRGNVVGASKIARDISERRRAEEQQDLLLREMDHRIKNLFALAIGIVSLSGRSARNIEDLVRSAQERLLALARAHALTLAHGPRDGSQGTRPTTLHCLIRTIVATYEDPEQGAKIMIVGPELAVSGSAVSESRDSAARIRDKFVKIWGALCAKRADRNRHRRTRPNRCPHLDGTRRTRDYLVPVRRRVWVHAHSRDGHEPTWRRNHPRLAA